MDFALPKKLELMHAFVTKKITPGTKRNIASQLYNNGSYTKKFVNELVESGCLIPAGRENTSFGSYMKWKKHKKNTLSEIRKSDLYKKFFDMLGTTKGILFELR